MPFTRQLELSEYEHCLFRDKATKPLDEVRVAVNAGSKLEIKQSVWTDPGDDFVEIKLNGEVILRVEGY